MKGLNRMVGMGITMALITVAPQPGAFALSSEDRVIVGIVETELARHVAAGKTDPRYSPSPDAVANLYGRLLSIGDPDLMLDEWHKVNGVVCCAEESIGGYERVMARYGKWIEAIPEPAGRYRARLRLVKTALRAPGLVACKWDNLFKAVKEAVEAYNTAAMPAIPATFFARTLGILGSIDSYHYRELKVDVDGDGDPDFLYLNGSGNCVGQSHILLRHGRRMLFASFYGTIELLLERTRGKGYAVVARSGCYMGGTRSMMRIMGVGASGMVDLVPAIESDFESGISCRLSRGVSPSYGPRNCSISFGAWSQGRRKGSLMKWDGARLIEPDKR